MGVDVDAPALGLLQQQLQIVQIVAGDDDERTFFHGQRNRDRRGRAVAFGVGPVQKRHAPEGLLADLHHNGQQLLHVPILAHGKERLGKEPVYRLIGIAQHQGVVRIRGHAAHAEENERFETADILLRIPELRHVIIAGSSARGSAGRAARHEPRFFRVHAADHRADGLIVKAHVRNGREQTLDEKLPCACIHAGRMVRRAGKANERARQLVLQLRRTGALAARARLSRAAGAARRLFALKTKHRVFHFEILTFMIWVLAFVAIL